MSELQPVENNLIKKYFDISIKWLGNEPKIKLSLKQVYKKDKLAPVKKVRDNGQVVVQTGEKYYTHYLGIEDGVRVFQARKKLYSIYFLIDWAAEHVCKSKDEKDRLLAAKNRKKERNSEGLKKHYSSDAGIKTKEKLRSRSEYWAPIIGKMNANLWKVGGYKEKIMIDREKTGFYEKNQKKMLKKYQDVDYRATMLEKARGKKRTDAISKKSKEMWANAKKYNSALYDRMRCSSINKNFVIDGIKMNSIEYSIATILNESGISWVYEKRVDCENQSYIPDFIIEDKKIIIECYGDFWHANPLLFQPENFLMRGLVVKDVWKRDKEKIDNLTRLGYKCLVFWESEINLELDKIKKTINYEYNK